MTLGGDSRELSALYVLRQFALLRNTTQFYKIQGGMDLLPRAMARSLGSIVRYNAAVDADRPERRDGSRRLRRERPDDDDPREPRDSRDPVFDASADRGPAAVLAREGARRSTTCRIFRRRGSCCSRAAVSGKTSGLSGSARTDQPAEIWDCTYDLPGTRGILARHRRRRASGTRWARMSRAGGDQVRGRSGGQDVSRRARGVSRRAASIAGRWTRGRAARLRSSIPAR